jgi:hypothetical protein
MTCNSNQNLLTSDNISNTASNELARHKDIHIPLVFLASSFVSFCAWYQVLDNEVQHCIAPISHKLVWNLLSHFGRLILNCISQRGFFSQEPVTVHVAALTKK